MIHKLDDLFASNQFKKKSDWLVELSNRSLYNQNTRFHVTNIMNEYLDQMPLDHYFGLFFTKTIITKYSTSHINITGGRNDFVEDQKVEDFLNEVSSRSNVPFETMRIKYEGFSFIDGDDSNTDILAIIIKPEDFLMLTLYS